MTVVEKWQVINPETGKEVQPDEVITDFHGGSARYRGLLQGPSESKQAVIEVYCPNEGCPSERSAWVFGLHVVAS